MELQHSLELRQLLPLIGAGVAIFLWFLTRWYELWRKRKDRQTEQRNLVRAIYAEIDFNTRDIQIFNETKLDVEKLDRHFIEDKNLIPHITDARHTEIYRARIADMHLFEDGVISEIVSFYGLLEKIKAQIDGLNSDSYRSISPNGKLTVVRNIYATTDLCEKSGKKLLAKVANAYKEMGLSRKERERFALHQGEPDA